MPCKHQTKEDGDVVASLDGKLLLYEDIASQLLKTESFKQGHSVALLHTIVVGQDQLLVAEFNLKKICWILKNW